MSVKKSLALAVVWALTGPLAGSQSVTTTIDFPNAMHTRPNGINAEGDIAGTYVIKDPVANDAYDAWLRARPKGIQKHRRS